MKAIVCVDNNWAIGKNGDLLFHIREDLQNFKKLTTNHPIVYGRKTLETFPKQKPLPKRDNYILTRDPNYKVEGAFVVHSIEEIPDIPDLIVIGGASVYEQLINRCSSAIVTVVDEEVKDADAFFPDLSKKEGWLKQKVGPWQTSEDGHKFRFVEWLNLDKFKM